MTKYLFFALVASGLAGCASVQIPPAQLEQSEASVRGAEELGAMNVPDAKLHLQLARDQSDQAKAMAKAGDDRAPLVLARAQSDAELALALAREAEVHGEAVKAAEDLKAVRARGTN
jgi:hypothetical protein